MEIVQEIGQIETWDADFFREFGKTSPLSSTLR
jgi:hypothetical protein